MARRGVWRGQARDGATQSPIFGCILEHTCRTTALSVFARMDSRAALSSDLIDHFKLDVQFAQDHTLQLSCVPNPALGVRKVKVKKKWYRDKKIGVGAFGRVWLEVVREGEDIISERAVKELGKDHLHASGIDFGRELLAE